jgi:hypothetical protein
MIICTNITGKFHLTHLFLSLTSIIIHPRIVTIVLRFIIILPTLTIIIMSFLLIPAWLLAANNIFFDCPKSCLHLCLLNFKFLSHFVNRQCFHFKRHLQIGLDLLFTTESMKNPPSLFGLSLISRLVLTFGLLLNGWNDFQTMSI